MFFCIIKQMLAQSMPAFVLYGYATIFMGYVIAY
jgi:hypothetical protein